jgi:hypothetical protein
MFKILVLLSFLLTFNIYSYSLGVGLIGGGGATDIKSLESTSSDITPINDFTYKYKLGANIINKFKVSETIFMKINLSLINFKIDFDNNNSSPFLIKTDLALEFYPIKELIENFYFGGGLFINYFLTSGYSEKNSKMSMLSAFMDMGYKVRLSKSFSFYGEFSVEIFDIISTESKTKAFVGVTSNFYVLYDF